jgi:hypothetical protein
MIQTMIDLGLTEDEANVIMEMTTIGNDDTDDIEMEIPNDEIEIGGTRLMKSERKGGRGVGRGMIGIEIDPESRIALILGRERRELVVGSEI